MGLFNKRRTTTEEVSEKFTQRKIVKLTYLQSLAIEGGLGSAQEYAGETKARETEVDSASAVGRNKLKQFGDSLQDIGSLPVDVGGWLLAPLMPLLAIPGIGEVAGGIINGLFGKSRSTRTDLTINDSGWNFVRSWKEPQFDIIRYSIGIKELDIAQFAYEQTSEVISKPWISPKEIQKISLVVDQLIPDQFPAGGTYIEYYVKPEIEDVDWIRINALDLPTQYTEDNKIVPRIISFNTEQPVNSNLEESYITTAQPVKSVRFRAVFKRPANIENSNVSADAYTPILRSYRLFLSPRNGL